MDDNSKSVTYIDNPERETPETPILAKIPINYTFDLSLKNIA